MLDAPKNAVPVGTVAGFQLAAVLKSELPGAVDQVAFWACAGMAASNAAAAVVANKYARIPLAPPLRRFSQRRPACSYKTVDDPRSGQCVFSSLSPASRAIAAR